eukprot:jgi/Galph1/5450/GphlegSOOS_G4075.1
MLTTSECQLVAWKIDQPLKHFTLEKATFSYNSTSKAIFSNHARKQTPQRFTFNPIGKPVLASNKQTRFPRLTLGSVTVPLGLTWKEKLGQVASATGLSFANGAFMGGLFGLVQGGISSKSFGGAFKEAVISGRTWGGISAVYACLQSASKVIRGRDDKYNNVVGACGSGAFFSWNGGLRAALQGCISFALFSYLIDMFLSPKESLEKRQFDRFTKKVAPS